ncbi:Ger(x)C family spore germination protein [Paenibacillus pedocola]|uniref:Ger(x)C family spore germination protein n=1 Tax=Paenibacillus pedocola TaxID=3242193 RepID=UPI00350E3B52
MTRLILCIAVTGVLLTGCWDSVELDRLAFTSATAVDYKDGKWLFSYQVVIPAVISSTSSAGGGKLPIAVYSTQGTTIKDAVSRSQLESSRKLFFSHTRSIIISEAAANHGLSQLLDVYLRNLDSRETVSVFITEGESRRILNQLIQLEVLPGEGIEDMIMGESSELSILPNVNMFKLGLSLLGTTKSAVLPEIIISGSPPVTTADELSKTELSSKIKLRRLAVLSQDKLVGWLSQKEAFGTGFIRNEIHKAVIPFSCARGVREPDSTFQFLHSNTQLTPRKFGNRITIEVRVKGEGELLETNCPIDFEKLNAEDEMEQQLEKEVEKMIIESWQAIKKLKTDIVDFADLVHRKYPKDYERMKSEWQKEFVQIEVVPKVDVKIRRVGLTMKSYKQQEEQK